MKKPLAVQHFHLFNFCFASSMFIYLKYQTKTFRFVEFLKINLALFIFTNSRAFDVHVFFVFVNKLKSSIFLIRTQYNQFFIVDGHEKQLVN